jgi:hypothetical protein
MDFVARMESVDNLFQGNYAHVNPKDNICSECKKDSLVARPSQDGPLIHFGVVASGNQVIKECYGESQDPCSSS